MSLPAPLARGRLATTSLAAWCLTIAAQAQYPTTQPYPLPSPSAASGSMSAPAGAAYPSTAYANLLAPAHLGARYHVAQADEGDAVAPADAPQESPSDMPPPPGFDSGNDSGLHQVPPPHVPPPVGGHPHVAPGGPGVGHNYQAYQPSCNCLDGGYSTWGLWNGYAPTSPCSGAGCNGGYGMPRSHLGGWLSSYDCGPGAGHPGAGCADGCNVCQESCVAPCRVWFGGVYALFMDRDLENIAWTSYDSANIANQVLSSRDASVDWQWGNEIRFGSTFLCHCWGWEAVYWGLYDEADSATETSASIGNPVSTVFDFGGLDYDDGTGVSGVNAYFDNAEAHRVRRHFEVQNVELNLIHFPLLRSVGPYGASRAGSGSCWTPGSPRFSLVGSAGLRYFRVDDGFSFATSPTDFVFGDDPDDMFYDIEMENHLVGVQLGAAANYQATQQFSLYADSKFGVYGNYIEHDSRIYGSNGFAVVTGGLPFAGQAYNIQSEKDDVAFLGELRLGAGYLVRPHWRLFGGWRAVGVVGYAHPTEQIPLNFAGTPDIVNLDSNGSLIVHGLEAGVEVNY